MASAIAGGIIKSGFIDGKMFMLLISIVIN